MILWLLLASAISVSAESARREPPELPEDIGPAVLDVSSYPQEQQRTYEEVLLPVYKNLRGGPARVLNSPVVEIDPAGEEAERKAHPTLYAESILLAPSRDGWRMEVIRIKTKPPCCGACPILSKEDAQRLWRFLVYDSLRRKTGPAAESWAAHRKELVRRFAASNQEKNP